METFVSSRYRLIVGFLSSDPSTQKSIITHDQDANVVIDRVKEIDSSFQILSTKTLSPIEALVIDHNRDTLFERIINSEELKRQLDHYRKPTQKSPSITVRKREQKEDDEEAKPFKIGRSSMITRMKSRIW